MMGQGRAWQVGPILPQPGARQPGGMGATPALGIRHHLRDRDRMRPGQDVGPWVG